MKNKIIISMLISSTLLLGGCASSGTQALKNESEASVAKKITEGKTTKNEVRSYFGSPNTTQFTDGGKEIWKYSLSNVTADAVNFVPIVSLFGSSYSGTKKELVVMYNRKDIVERFSMSESDVSRKSGLFK